MLDQDWGVAEQLTCMLTIQNLTTKRPIPQTELHELALFVACAAVVGGHGARRTFRDAISRALDEKRDEVQD